MNTGNFMHSWKGGKNQDKEFFLSEKYEVFIDK